MINVVERLLSLNKEFAIFVILIWITYHWFFRRFYWKKYKEIDYCEIILNFIRCILCLSVWLFVHIYYKDISKMHELSEVLSLFVYTLTAVEGTISGLNSVGILVAKMLYHKAFENNYGREEDN